jgi:hypothetical protein
MRDYTKLHPSSGLEQTIAVDLRAAVASRGGTVAHHGTASSHAPSTAPADITLDWTTKGTAWRLLVEVTKQLGDSEFVPIKEHLDRALSDPRFSETHVLYASPRTSARMARAIRDENLRRASAGIAGRILFVSFGHLRAMLDHWADAPTAAYPLTGLEAAIRRWSEFTDDFRAASALQDCVFPAWTNLRDTLAAEREVTIAGQQEKLRRDILNLENKLREGNSSIVGQTAQRYLIYLFFAAVFEDQRGPDSRLTAKGFATYRKTIPPGDNAPGKPYADRSLHHLIDKVVRYDPALATGNLLDMYEPIELPDLFIEREVIPVFEAYSLANSGMDFIGAVFEALARRAEKDNRLGQFFTPESAVRATVRLADLLASDTVLDPACGTGRFLIHAMDDMLSKAGPTPGRTVDEVRARIKEHQLLGTEINPWVALIAKMNMYLHGDGRSNIAAKNGLALSDQDVFAGRTPSRAHESIDVVLMNPPLGDADHLAVARDLATAGLIPVAAKGAHPTAKEIEDAAHAWAKERLHAVPSTSVDVEKLAEAHAREARHAEREMQARIAGDRRAEANAARHRAAARKTASALEAAIARGEETFRMGGSKAKGGALFLSVVRDYLKPVRHSSYPEEWQGGLCGAIIDEALLNAPSYASARGFLRRDFFIKAIISLPRDAFAFLAKTTAKTSIVLLARKPNPSVTQCEPVFFARAGVIGYTSTGSCEQNDLIPICEAFSRWRASVMAAYSGPHPDQAKLAAARSDAEAAGHAILAVDLPHSRSARLDHAWQRKERIVASLRRPVRLGEFLEPRVETPFETDRLPSGDWLNAYVQSTDGRARSRGARALAYKLSDLRVIRTNDILVSGIDARRGAIGLVPASLDGHVVSKEFIVLAVRAPYVGAIEPGYLAAMLRSTSVREMINGVTTGVSNRTRIETPSVLLDLPIEKPPAHADQLVVWNRIMKVYDQLDAAETELNDIASSLT